MGKSANGPDMRDCATLFHEMQMQQDCNSTLMLELGGSELAPRWRIHVLSTSDELANLLPIWTVASYYVWPNRENQGFASALFRALMEHDAMISKQAFQTILDITA